MNSEIKIQPSITSNSDRITFYNHKGIQTTMTLEQLIQAYNKASKQKSTYWTIYQMEKVKSKVLGEKLRLYEKDWDKGVE